MLSIVQKQIRQQFGSYCEFPVVFDESQCSEFVHKVRDARPRRAHHFGKRLVTQHGDTGIQEEIMFPKPCKFQEDTGQAFLAVIEKLIAEIFFEVNVAGQQ